jgi:hypothetical protein
MTSTKPELSTSRRDDRWLNSSGLDEDYQTHEGITTTKGKIKAKTSSDHAHGEDVPKTNHDHNSNSKGPFTTPPTPPDQPTITYKYLWTYPAPGHPITDANIRTTTHIPITPNPNMAMWRKYQYSKTIDPNAPKDHASIAERQDTSPKTAEAGKRPT